MTSTMHAGNGAGTSVATHGPGAMSSLLGEDEATDWRRVEVKVIRSPELLDQLSRDRRETYARLGVQMHDAALDFQRRVGTTLGLFVDGELVGGFSVWRLSEGLCSLGYLLRDVPVEKYPPDKVVELALMFVRPDYSGRGYVRALLEAGRVLIAGMKPELLVAFAVPTVVDRYVEQYGFRPVGPFVRHPLIPSVQVMPLVATWDEIARTNFV